MLFWHIFELFEFSGNIPLQVTSHGLDFKRSDCWKNIFLNRVGVSSGFVNNALNPFMNEQDILQVVYLPSSAFQWDTGPIYRK